MTAQALAGHYPVDRFSLYKGGPGSGPHSNGGSHYGDHWPKPKMWGNGGRRPMTGLPKGPNVPDPKLHGTPNPYTKYVPSDRSMHSDQGTGRTVKFEGSEIVKGGPGSGRHPEDGAEASSTEGLTASGHRPLGIIAREIRNDWGSQGKGVYFGAKPYLDAMSQLSDIKDRYGMDGAKSIVAYFLSNASTWKGEKARAIKAELKKIMNTKGVSF